MLESGLPSYELVLIRVCRSPTLLSSRPFGKNMADFELCCEWNENAATVSRYKWYLPDLSTWRLCIISSVDMEGEVAGGGPELKLELERHASYLSVYGTDKDDYDFCKTEFLRMSGMYWGLTALELMAKSSRYTIIFTYIHVLLINHFIKQSWTLCLILQSSTWRNLGIY